MEANAVARGNSRSALRSLSLYCDVKGIKEPPASKEDKRVLVEFLLRLFPNLKDLKFENAWSSSKLIPSELQEILAKMEQGLEEVVGSA